MEEGFMDGWSGLHVQCEDLGMSVQVNEKCVAGPVTLDFDFDNVKRNVVE